MPEPLPLYSLVRTRGPGSRVNPERPLGIGVVTERRAAPWGRVYAIAMGEVFYLFNHDEVIPLGCVLDPLVMSGADAELRAAPRLCSLGAAPEEVDTLQAARTRRAATEPLPFFTLVRVGGPVLGGVPAGPSGVGVVVGRVEDHEGWHYAVSLGGIMCGFLRHELTPLGCVLDRLAFYGTAAEAMNAPRLCYLDEALR